MTHPITTPSLLIDPDSGEESPSRRTPSTDSRLQVPQPTPTVLSTSPSQLHCQQIINVILQDPVIPPGSVRFNLDRYSTLPSADSSGGDREPDEEMLSTLQLSPSGSELSPLSGTGYEGEKTPIDAKPLCETRLLVGAYIMLCHVVYLGTKPTNLAVRRNGR